MNKKLSSLLLAGILALSNVPTMAADAEISYAKTQAAYGTPVIDGKIDKIWDNTAYNSIAYNMYVDEDFYSGWFKVMWDEDKMYVLAKVYGDHFDDSNASPWNNDSFEVFVDENHERTKTYQEDDYQIRGDYNAYVSAQNYEPDDVIAASEPTENYYVLEMAWPYKTIKAKEGMVLGFNIQVNVSATLVFGKTMYGWNLAARYGSPSGNTSIFGDIELVKVATDNTSFNEPVYAPPTISGYDEVDEAVTYKTVNGVTTKFDDKSYDFPLLLADEEPMLTLEQLGTVIEGTVSGNTLVKDDTTITFIENSRLAEYNGGHLMLERAPVMNGGKLYVPVSVVMPTLCYHMEYWRFDDPPTLEITTGTNYPEPEVILNVADFGAVGDGVTDDKQAIIDAINAAMMTGKPTRLEFQEGATYRLSERLDRVAYISMSSVQNIELEGNGCTFLAERPTTMFLNLSSCTNVKIKNIKILYEEHTSTQGRIVAVDKENLTFDVKLDDGFPNISPEEWQKLIGFSWYFGQLYHPTEDRIKITDFDTVLLNGIEEIGDRLYRIPIPVNRKAMIDCYEVGDRLVLPTRGSNYDTPNDRTYAAATEIRGCKDIVLDGVTITGASQLGASVGLCAGRITFRNYKMERKEGALIASNSDGIHYWRNRAGLVLENSELNPNLDDHVNTKGEDSCLVKKLDSRTILTQEVWIYKVGDEIVFYDTDSKHIVGRAFITDYTREGGNAKLTFDRDIDLTLLRDMQVDKSSNPTRVYDLNVVGEGTVIRNTTFYSSRRHAYIGRSQNSIFMNNRVIDCGGSAVAAMNEVRSGTGPCEGLFPSSFTMRDNYIEGKDGNTTGYYPIEINSFQSTMDAQSAIDGVLLENNTVNVPNKNHAIVIKAVDNLYMYNNRVIYNKDPEKKTVPIYIGNSEIEEIDGLSFEGSDKNNTFMEILGCKVDEANLKNINVSSGKKYSIK